MRTWGVVIAAALLTAPAWGQVKDTSFKDLDGGRVIREAVVVNAPRAEVWKAFAVDEVFLKWSGQPVAHITPGNGGSIEFGFDPKTKIGDKGNVINRIDIWLPGHLMAFHNEFVPDNPVMSPKEFGSVRTMLTFEDAGKGKTKVTETVIGFGASPAYDSLYKHLHDGNKEYLTSLQTFFAKKAG